MTANQKIGTTPLIMRQRVFHPASSHIHAPSIPTPQSLHMNVYAAKSQKMVSGTIQPMMIEGLRDLIQIIIALNQIWGATSTIIVHPPHHCHHLSPTSPTVQPQAPHPTHSIHSHSKKMPRATAVTLTLVTHQIPSIVMTIQNYERNSAAWR